MKKIILTLTLLSTFLFGTNFQLKSGWNLLGTNTDILASRVLQNDNILNVAIYDNGRFKTILRVSSDKLKSSIFSLLQLRNRSVAQSNHKMCLNIASLIFLSENF